MHRWRQFKQLITATKIAVFARDNLTYKINKTPAINLAKKYHNPLLIFHTKQCLLSSTDIKNSINILLNEEPMEMKFGINTTLLYILVAIECNKNVYLTMPDKTYQIKTAVAQKLIPLYKASNNDIRQQNSNQQNLQQILLQEQLLSPININTAFIPTLNRMEPMKSPFPPHGNTDTAVFLQQLAQKYPHTQNQLGLSDKDIVPELSIPTIQINDLQQLALTTMQASKIFGHHLVFKPKDSAQGVGVFKIEFTEQIKQNSDQSYQLAQSLLHQQNILQQQLLNLFYQQAKKNIEFGSLDSSNIFATIKRVYGKHILLQPFLPGIADGDFRLIFSKNNDFVYDGAIFRQKNQQLNTAFTTCATTGQSLPTANIPQKYQKILEEFTAKYLAYLNSAKIKAKYAKIFIIGADVIISGGKAYLGEQNLWCPALISMLGNNADEAFAIAKKHLSPLF